MKRKFSSDQRFRLITRKHSCCRFIKKEELGRIRGIILNGHIGTVKDVQIVEPDEILVDREKEQLLIPFIYPVDFKSVGIHCLSGGLFHAGGDHFHTGTFEHPLLKELEIIHHIPQETRKVNGFLPVGAKLAIHGITGLP